MKLQNNTVLITGGSSGIGLELAKKLSEKGNKVIICGRSLAKLEQAKKELPEIHTFQCDVSEDEDRMRLAEWISQKHPNCNILINNAAIVSKTDFRADYDMVKKAELEIKTNLIAPVCLSKLFLQILEKNKQPAIVNITTGLVFAPRIVYPIYNATKSGLHAFTQVLRHQLKDTPVAIIEVMMPAVDTPWHGGNPPKIAISTEKAVGEMINKIEKGQQEIKIAGVNILYWLSRISPSFAFKKINQL